MQNDIKKIVKIFILCYNNKQNNKQNERAQRRAGRGQAYEKFF